MQVKNEFRNRINKLYTHPALGPMVDSGELDLHLLNLFEELVATSRNLIYVNSYYAINEVMVSPLFEACFDCNIIWKSKYYGYFTLDNPLSAFVIH